MTEDEPEQPTRAMAPRFQFVRELGKGVLGEAHEVLDEATGNPVVLKLFVRCRPKQPEAFRLEFESLARLQHPGLVHFYHLIDPKSDTNITLEERLGTTTLAFTEEYVDGQGLLDYLDQKPTEEEETTLDERRVLTGEVPSVELPSGELPSGELPSGELPSGELPSGELPSGEVVSDEVSRDASKEVITDGLVSASEELEVQTDELSIDTREVQAVDEASVQEVLDAVIGESGHRRVLDVVFLRLERVVPQIAAGLEYLHRFQKVHGNMRPTNILVDKAGTAKLTDFGIVPRLVYMRDDEDESAIPLLQAPENLPFLPPEAIEMGATPSGDLFALGCVLYEAIAGQSPHDAMEFIDGRLRPPPLADLVKECPASWASVVDGLLNEDPEDRPSLRRVVEVVSGSEARPVVLPPSAVPEPENFVGRDHIVEGLKHEAEASSNERHLRLVLLDGETGIGKTQILGRVSHWLSRRGWLILHGRCYNREAVPYQGWYEVADQLAAIIDGLPAGVLEEIRADRLAAGRILPQLSPIEGAHETKLGRLHAIDGLRKILARISSQRPILLYLQDLQWASWDTSSLLIDLFSNSEGIRCLVVGTWQDDVKRSAGHLLHRDLDLALLDLTRMRIRGFSHEEAGNFAKLAGVQLNPAHVSSLLQQRWLNPLLLRELKTETTDIDAAIEALTLNLGDRKPRARDLLKAVYKRRIEDLGRRDMTLLNILAVASGPLPLTILHEAAETELSSTVLPQEGTESAIDDAVELLMEHRLVRRVDEASLTLAQEVVREHLLDTLAERDHSRLSGRIADAYAAKVPNRHDLRFEYAMRGGRVATAIESAVDAAEDAERRFAYHRAAKLWRWLLEREADIPEYSMILPESELARVEHLAGQHAEAAELYSRWAEREKNTAPIAIIRLREAQAWLQAGDSQRATDALMQSLVSVGDAYSCTIVDRVVDLPTRFVTASSRWSKSGGEVPQTDVASEETLNLAAIYYFAADGNPWLNSTCGSHFEAKLARLAERVADAKVLGMARLKSAEFQSAEGHLKYRQRCLEWVEDAHRFFELCGSADWVAQAWFHEGMVRYRFGEYADAYSAFKRAFDTSAASLEFRAFDARRNLHWTAWCALRTGRIDEALSVARRILHVYRGDRLASLLAYEVMAQVELLRGDVDRAEQFLDAAAGTMTWHPLSLARGALLSMTAQLHIARGRPEVSVGQLELMLEADENEELLKEPAMRFTIMLALGQSLAAAADLERALSERGFRERMNRLKVVRKDLSKMLGRQSPQNAAETHRLFACIELLKESPRRALKEADLAVEALSNVADPIAIAKCTEVRGRILAEMERPEAKQCLGQAFEVYTQLGCAFPLVLEGWPVSTDHSSLKPD